MGQSAELAGMADEINASLAESVKLAVDVVEEITGYFCRIDNSVSARYLLIKELENFVETKSGKFHRVNDLLFDRTNALHHLAETIRNDLEKADAIMNAGSASKWNGRINERRSAITATPDSLAAHNE